jgi:RimJ/RimL family protein N-acetyltransferase
MLVCRSARLLLRTIEPADAPFYLALLNDPGWLLHIGDRNVRTLSEAHAAILGGPHAMQARFGFSLYVVARALDALPLGLCGLIKRDTLPEVDLGYAFLAEHCGQGYAYEAASAVLEHARADVGLSRVLGITSPHNAISNRLLQKLGFRLERVAQLAAGEGDTNVYVRDLG